MGEGGGAGRGGKVGRRTEPDYRRSCIVIARRRAPGDGHTNGVTSPGKDEDVAPAPRPCPSVRPSRPIAPQPRTPDAPSPSCSHHSAPRSSRHRHAPTIARRCRSRNTEPRPRSQALAQPARHRTSSRHRTDPAPSALSNAAGIGSPLPPQRHPAVHRDVLLAAGRKDRPSIANIHNSSNSAPLAQHDCPVPSRRTPPSHKSRRSKRERQSCYGFGFSSSFSLAFGRPNPSRTGDR